MPKKNLETPAALPMLTRFMPVELKAVRKSKTPITEAALREALAKFNIKLPDANRTWRRLVADAKRLNVAIETPSPELVAWRAVAEAEPDPGDPNEADEIDERDGDVFEMSFSSETPVPRWFGDEILDHSSAAVDLSRAANGLSYLVDHDTGDQVAIIENFRLDGKKTKGNVRFSRSQRAQDIKRDVEDGIRPFTSIGYRVIDMILESKTDEDNRTYRVTRWAPMEGSSVAVPADYSVGPGRSASEREYPISVRSAANPAVAPPPQIEVRTMNPKDMREFLLLCNSHGIDNKRGAEILEKGGDNFTLDQAARVILADVAARGANPVATPAAERSGEMLELTDKEQKEYNICRGIMTQLRNIDSGRNDTCFETEVSDTIAKTWEGKRHGGMFVPFRLKVDAQKAARGAEALGLAKRAATTLTAATATKGAETVFTEPGAFIEFLYNKMRLKELGAQTLSGLQGNVGFPKQTGKASGSWVAENPGADVADSNLTLSQVTITPKTYQSSASYSRQLMAQSVVDVDNLVRSDLARDVALAIDLAGISGTGSANDPKGILHTAGVGSYTLEGDAGNGAKPTWDDVTLMEESLEDVNADQIGDFAWLTTPGIKGLFKRTPRLLYAPAGGTVVNVTGDPIWTDQNEIDGLMSRVSNQVPKNLTIGTSVGIAHALILGVFGSLINGLWGSGFELVVDPYRLKKQGLIELTTFVLTDWGNRYPAGFLTAVDCLKS
jgi:hypothetical protein